MKHITVLSIPVAGVRYKVVYNATLKTVKISSYRGQYTLHSKELGESRRLIKYVSWTTYPLNRIVPPKVHRGR